MAILSRVVGVKESSLAGIFTCVTPIVNTLYVAADNLDDVLSRPKVSIVGSRKISAYGRAVTAQLAGDLARQGIVIVSGLAYGVDSVAHRAALEAGGLTIAVLPSSIESIYPAAHRNLAAQIVEQGGALVTEYTGSGPAYKNQFIARNRIVSGVSDALLITEAALNSGTMHTARFALEQGKEVLAVPGNITSPTSSGTNNLIKTGATPITDVSDVLHVLGLEPAIKMTPTSEDPMEQCILDLLNNNVSDGNALLHQSRLTAAQFNQSLIMMEIRGKIRSMGGNQWALA